MANLHYLQTFRETSARWKVVVWRRSQSLTTAKNSATSLITATEKHKMNLPIHTEGLTRLSFGNSAAIQCSNGTKYQSALAKISYTDSSLTEMEFIGSNFCLRLQNLLLAS